MVSLAHLVNAEIVSPYSRILINTGVGNPTVPLLQGRIRDLLEREITLVVVAQVMLIRRTLPCKRRPLRLWEFNPEGP